MSLNSKMMLRKDPKTRFDATVAEYARWRPSYPSDLFDWIVATTRVAPGARVADIGCGIGISSKPLAERGFIVIGLDPSEKMLLEGKRLCAGVPNLELRVGEAAETGLPDASVDLVVSGQAFHWFDLAATLPELRRILKDPAWCSAFWNIPDEDRSALVREYRALLRRTVTEKEVFTMREETVAELRRYALSGGIAEATFSHSQWFDREGFRGRVYSSSYVVHGISEDDRGQFDREIELLFDRHEKQGIVEYPYRTMAYAWRLAPRDGK